MGPANHRFDPAGPSLGHGQLRPLYYLVAAWRELALGHLGSPAVGQAFAVLVPLCVLVLAWATPGFRQAVS